MMASWYTSSFLKGSEIPSHSDGKSPVYHVVSFNFSMLSLQRRCKDGCTAAIRHRDPLSNRASSVVLVIIGSYWPFAFSVARVPYGST